MTIPLVDKESQADKAERLLESDTQKLADELARYKKRLGLHARHLTQGQREAMRNYVGREFNTILKSIEDAGGETPLFSFPKGWD